MTAHDVFAALVIVLSVGLAALIVVGMGETLRAVVEYPIQVGHLLGVIAGWYTGKLIFRTLNKAKP